MSRFAYIAVLIIALGSVVFGLDWVSAPMSPMPDLKVAVAPWIPPIVAPAPVVVVPVPTIIAPAPSVAASPIPEPAAPAASRQMIGAGVAQPAGASAGRTASEAPPNCNVSACAAAYFTFQAADCSYQPVNGPRRRCTKK